MSPTQSGVYGCSNDLQGMATSPPVDSKDSVGSSPGFERLFRCMVLAPGF